MENEWGESIILPKVSVLIVKRTFTNIYKNRGKASFGERIKNSVLNTVIFKCLFYTWGCVLIIYMYRSRICAADDKFWNIEDTIYMETDYKVSFSKSNWYPSLTMCYQEGEYSVYFSNSVMVFSGQRTHSNNQHRCMASYQNRWPHGHQQRLKT